MAGCVEFLTCRRFRANFAARFHKRPTCESSALRLVRVYFGFSRGLSLGLVEESILALRRPRSKAEARNLLRQLERAHQSILTSYLPPFSILTT